MSLKRSDFEKGRYFQTASVKTRGSPAGDNYRPRKEVTKTLDASEHPTFSEEYERTKKYDKPVEESFFQIGWSGGGGLDWVERAFFGRLLKTITKGIENQIKAAKETPENKEQRLKDEDSLHKLRLLGDAIDRHKDATEKSHNNERAREQNAIEHGEAKTRAGDGGTEVA